MNKHSKGPWKAQEYEDGRISILHSVKDDSALVLADMVHTGREREDAELIAAAPELLEALKEMVKMCNMASDNVSYRAKAIKAIAKAEGKEGTK